MACPATRSQKPAAVGQLLRCCGLDATFDPPLDVRQPLAVSVESGQESLVTLRRALLEPVDSTRQVARNRNHHRRVRRQDRYQEPCMHTFII